MPQVDKSASTYSPPIQYVPAIPGRPDINKVCILFAHHHHLTCLN